MQIEDFKRWHWIVISLVIGGLLGYARSMVAPDEQSSGRGISAVEFIGNVGRPKTGNGYQWVSNITVYPPEETASGGSKEKHYANFVTCRLLTMLPNGKGQYKPVHLTAEIPFSIGNVKANSIREYLAELQQNNADVKFRFAWWSQGKAQYALWMGGALVLIGGVWPTLVNLMIGAGMGRPKKAKEEYDLSRFGKSPEPSKSTTATTVKAGMSAADAQRLADLQEEMEKNVAGLKLTGAPGEPASAGGSGPKPIKTLTGGPVESQTIEKEDESKEYGGEYYPVAKPHHHEEKPKE